MSQIGEGGETHSRSEETAQVPALVNEESIRENEDTTTAPAPASLISNASPSSHPPFPPQQMELTELPTTTTTVTIHLVPSFESNTTADSNHSNSVESSQSHNSTIIHSHDVYNAAPSTVSSSGPTITIPSSVITSPSPATIDSSSTIETTVVDSASAISSTLDWLVELRSEWSQSDEVRQQQKDTADQRREKALHEARGQPRRLQMSPALQVTPPLQGDVVWNPTHKKITVAQYDDFLYESKLHHYRFERMVRQIISMFKPVILLCIVIFIYSQLCVKHNANTFQAWKILVYKETSEDSTLHKFTGSLINSMTVLGAIIFVTFTFLIFYYLEWRASLRRFLTAVIMTLLLPWIYFAYQIIHYYRIPVDGISFSLFLYQGFGMGFVALILRAETASNLNRAYLLVLTMSVTWPFMEFPEWTVWTTIIVLTIYDLLAVLTPCGPLKWLMNKEVHIRSQGLPQVASERLPGMMYHGESFMLGLGDLIFYGALMGRAANAGLLPLVATCLGVLMGLAGTILWSYNTTAHAIPALPLSVLFGLSFYAATSLSILPHLRQSAVGGWQT